MADTLSSHDISRKVFADIPSVPITKETYAKKIKKSPSETFLPHVHVTETGHHTHFRAGSHNSDKALPAIFTKNLIASQKQIEAAEGHLERFRIMLREKEIDLSRSKNENVLLKQVLVN